MCERGFGLVRVMGLDRMFSQAVRIGVVGLVAGCSGERCISPIEPTSSVVLVIEPSVYEDISPFTVRFRAFVGEGEDPTGAVSWDFDNDGEEDTTGQTVSHTFYEPADYVVTASTKAESGERVVADVTVSGYQCLMTLTFDDGLASVYERALPILDSAGVTGTAYIVVNWIGRGPDYMTWEEVGALQDAGWDIGSHSMNHFRLSELSEEKVDAELRLSRDELRLRGFPAKNFALPYGAGNAKVNAAVMEYYCSNRACGDAMNPLPEKADRGCLLCLGTENDRPLSTYYSQIDKAVKTRSWYILNNHAVQADCGAKVWCEGGGMLSEIIRYAQAKRVRIVNVEEALTGGWKSGPAAGEVGDLCLRSSAPN
jgi:peptidoglycan/xylan/chitin deacetylase (PgdA/CDA1 family)